MSIGVVAQASVGTSNEHHPVAGISVQARGSRREDGFIIRVGVDEDESSAYHER
jgi:hypothetical protein